MEAADDGKFAAVDESRAEMDDEGAAFGQTQVDATKVELEVADELMLVLAMALEVDVREAEEGEVDMPMVVVTVARRVVSSTTWVASPSYCSEPTPPRQEVVVEGWTVTGKEKTGGRVSLGKGMKSERKKRGRGGRRRESDLLPSPRRYETGTKKMRSLQVKEEKLEV